MQALLKALWVLPFLAWMASAAPSAAGYRLDGRSPIYATAPGRSLDLTDEVSLEAWVKADQMDAAGGRILDKSAPGTQLGFMLDTWPGNSVRFLNAKGMCRVDAKLPADQWTHVVGVYSASRKVMRVYLNGKAVASLEGGDWPPMAKSPVPFCVGCDPAGGNRFSGRILRAAVYGRALAPEEVLQRARDTGSNALPGVLGEWEFSEHPGERVEPVSGKLALQSVPVGNNPSQEIGLEEAVKLTGQSSAPEEPLSLWYRRPARQWVEALAVGNGRLGAMVWGGILTEQLQLNEDTLWGGGPYNPNNPGALAALPESRRLIFAGKYKEAEELVNQKMIAKPRGQMPYQAVGDLVLNFPEVDSVTDYRRELDLDKAIARVSYSAQGVRFTREVFASPADQVIVMRLTSDHPHRIAFAAGVRTPQQGSVKAELPDTLVLSGVNGDADGIKGALKFQARVRAIASGGSVSTEEATLSVSNADSVMLLIAMATSYKNFKDVSGDPEALTRACLAAAATKSFEALREAHVAEHQRLFHRLTLDLGSSPASQRPTDERIQDFALGGDPQLAALYFQFGRYLLISCSRPGGRRLAQ